MLRATSATGRPPSMTKATDCSLPPLFMACSGVGKLVAINDEKCLLSAIMRLSRFTVSRTERHLSRGFYGVVEGTGRRGRRARCRVARGVGRDAAARGPDRADRRPVGGAGPARLHPAV